MEWKRIPDDQLLIGDMVRVIGTVCRITDIRPYCGVLKDEGCFAICDTVPGVGFSLWKSSETEVLR